MFLISRFSTWFKGLKGIYNEALKFQFSQKVSFLEVSEENVLVYLDLVKISLQIKITLSRLKSPFPRLPIKIIKYSFASSQCTPPTISTKFLHTVFPELYIVKLFVYQNASLKHHLKFRPLIFCTLENKNEGTYIELYHDLPSSDLMKLN